MIVAKTIQQNLDYLPFGENNSTDSGISTHEFTGNERDSETSLDHTQFRQYTSQLARWITPDPAGLFAVDPMNPQSWNRYAYVENDPLDFFDPTGQQLKGPNGTPGSTVDPGVLSPSGLIPLYAVIGIGVDASLVQIGWIPFGGRGQMGAPLVGVSGGGNSSGGILSRLKNAVSAVCSAIPDAGSVGAGADVGAFITGSYQLSLTANGASGELTLSLSAGFSGGVIGPDAYVSASLTPNAPDNSFLDTHGQPSTSAAVGVERLGYSGGDGTHGVTYGPSLFPVTVAKQLMLTKPLINVPYLGYLANPARAVCHAVTGH